MVINIYFMLFTIVRVQAISSENILLFQIARSFKNITLILHRTAHISHVFYVRNVSGAGAEAKVKIPKGETFKVHVFIMTYLVFG